MKKKNHITVPPRYIFAALAILCIGMMYASYATGFAGSTLGRITGYVFVPFERGINSVGGWFRDKSDSLAGSGGTPRRRSRPCRSRWTP